jgi:hypothetical protein
MQPIQERGILKLWSEGQGRQTKRIRRKGTQNPRLCKPPPLGEIYLIASRSISQRTSTKEEEEGRKSRFEQEQASQDHVACTKKNLTTTGVSPLRVAT